LHNVALTVLTTTTKVVDTSDAGTFFLSNNASISAHAGASVNCFRVGTGSRVFVSGFSFVTGVEFASEAVFAVSGATDTLYVLGWGNDGTTFGARSFKGPAGAVVSIGRDASSEIYSTATVGGATQTVTLTDQAEGVEYTDTAPLLGDTDVQGAIDALKTHTPVGALMEYAKPNATAPTGWLRCDGSAVSRTTYAALFAVCGISYGAGDGSTTFNLPSMDATEVTTVVKT
jgi:hypothetical protein